MSAAERPRALTLLLASLSTCALALTGCAGPEPASDDRPGGAGTPASGQDTSGGTDNDGANGAQTATAVATFTVDGRSFTFTPTTCLIMDEELLVGGPGADDASGELAYLDVDIVDLGEEYTGGVRVTLGTDQMFDSRDEFYSSEFWRGDDYGISSGTGSAIFLNYSSEFYFAGETPVGQGTLDVDCG